MQYDLVSATQRFIGSARPHDASTYDEPQSLGDVKEGHPPPRRCGSHMRVRCTPDVKQCGTGSLKQGPLAVSGLDWSRKRLTAYRNSE